MNRMSFGDWFRDWMCKKEDGGFAKESFHANDEYIDHLEKKNEILVEAVNCLSNYVACNGDTFVMDRANEALEEIERMR